MPGLIRRSTFLAIVAYHALMSACGPALHALPGSGHGGGAGRLAREVASVESGSAREDRGHHCPICQFVVPGPPPPPTDAPRRADAPGDAPPRADAVAATTPILPGSPRAPPSVGRG